MTFILHIIHILFSSLQKILSKMRLHYKTCRKYIEEFGPISAPSVPLPTRTPDVPQNSVFIPNNSIPAPSNRYSITPFLNSITMSKRADLALGELTHSVESMC